MLFQMIVLLVLLRNLHNDFRMNSDVILIEKVDVFTLAIVSKFC